MNLNSVAQVKLIVRKLNNLCKYLNREYSINYGGCCYVAYVIAKLLESDDIKFRLVVYSEDEIIENSIEDLYESCSHCSISLEGGLDLNDDGCKKDSSLERYEFIVESRDILKYYKKCDWNPYYDIHLNPFISKILKISYDNITKNLREGQCSYKNS